MQGCGRAVLLPTQPRFNRVGWLAVCSGLLLGPQACCGHVVCLQACVAISSVSVLRELRELRACYGNVLLALRSVLSLGCAALFVSSGVSAALVSSEVLAAQPAKAGQVPSVCVCAAGHPFHSVQGCYHTCGTASESISRLGSAAARCRQQRSSGNLRTAFAYVHWCSIRGAAYPCVNTLPV